MTENSVLLAKQSTGSERGESLLSSGAAERMPLQQTAVTGEAGTAAEEEEEEEDDDDEVIEADRFPGDVFDCRSSLLLPGRGRVVVFGSAPAMACFLSTTFGNFEGPRSPRSECQCNWDGGQWALPLTRVLCTAAASFFKLAYDKGDFLLGLNDDDDDANADAFVGGFGDKDGEKGDIGESGDSGDVVPFLGDVINDAVPNPVPLLLLLPLWLADLARGLMDSFIGEKRDGPAP